MAFGNGAPRGWPPTDGGGGDVDADQQPQWIPAGAWIADESNTQSFADLFFGALPATRGVYHIYPFPDAIVGEKQYLYFVTAPPLNWTSTKIKAIIHFIVDDGIVLPGVFKFDLNAARLPDVGVVNPTKAGGTINYNLADNNQPRYRITGETSDITIPNAVATDGILLELTRDITVDDDESDEANFVGLVLKYI